MLRCGGGDVLCGGEEICYVEVRRCVMWRVEVMLGEARNTDYA